jgi:hypothetical protein
MVEERNTGLVIGIAAVVVVAVVAALLLVLANRDDPVVAPTPTPVTPGTTAPEATPTVTPTETPTEGETATPTPEPTGPREPTDADAAAFASGYRPSGATEVESLTIDITGDGRPEIVFAAVTGSSVRMDVAEWTGTEYAITFTGLGGAAERLDELRVRDFTADGIREIVTLQSVGGEGASLSVWGWDGQGFVAQEADGGCWDGSNTFGIIGADIGDREIRATCDGSPLPTAAWPTDVYVWDGRTWVFDRREAP